MSAETESYLQTTLDIYKEAALSPQEGLCCTTTPIWQLPGLDIPTKMLKMNYGCGSTVHPRDLLNTPSILYVGVGGGMELLQFAYFSRQEANVIGIDPVKEMIESCAQNLIEAENSNPWFNRKFIQLIEGTALKLPVDDSSIDVAAQNCLFNIFKAHELRLALDEIYRVLKPHGRLVLSDPVCETEIPEDLKNDEKLRALCLSGAIPLHDYIQMLTDTGFGTIEIRAKRPYRVLDPVHYATNENLLIESVEVCAIKDPMPEDGPCVFTGCTAIYYGSDDYFDDEKGHILMQNQPVSVCDKTASNLSALGKKDILVTGSTFHYDGGGCC